MASDPGTVPESLSDLLSRQSPVVNSPDTPWQTVNNSNTVPIASPGPMKGGKTLVQVAKEILNEYPDGLTLQDICHKSNGAQSKSGQAPRTAKNSMGATLS